MRIPPSSTPRHRASYNRARYIHSNAYGDRSGEQTLHGKESAPQRAEGIVDRRSCPLVADLLLAASTGRFKMVLRANRTPRRRGPDKERGRNRPDVSLSERLRRGIQDVRPNAGDGIRNTGRCSTGRVPASLTPTRSGCRPPHLEGPKRQEMTPPRASAFVPPKTGNPCGGDPHAPTNRQPLFSRMGYQGDTSPRDAEEASVGRWFSLDYRPVPLRPKGNRYLGCSGRKPPLAARTHSAILESWPSKPPSIPMLRLRRRS